MHRDIVLYLAAILSGFALIRVSLAGTPLASLDSIFALIGVLGVLVFSVVILFKAVMHLFHR
ncbi:hypothetical protein [Bacillus fonticola]|uniref:hypothetical protein n=1 Tax=Bacillus fonticola TaxID=2728853 RepID=UPI00147413CF|nr:hypothetical protein [Bacillus fonticola]